jgi:hypothetical protein
MNQDPRKFKKPYTHRRFASPKDYSHNKTLGAAALQFPYSLLALSRLLIQTQENCTAYSGVAEREPATGKKYDAELQWKAELDFMGVKDANGATMETKFAVGVKVGFFIEGQTTPSDTATAYFFVKKSGGLDWFDSVRSAINQLYIKYGKVIPLSVGMNWYSEWDFAPNGIIPDSATSLLGGHDVKIAGFETYSDGVDYIRLQNSWGPEYGDQGTYRVSRQVFNKYFDVYGAGYWVDDRDLKFKQYGLLAAMLQNLVALYQTIVNSFNVPVPPPPQPIPPPPETPKPVYLWDTPENARHSVRVICDEEGLSLADKNDLCACVQVESEFNPKALHRNRGADGIQILSTDYGIVQVNDFYHIGPGKDFPSVDYVLNNPEACVRWMARLFKAGKQNLWASYTSGAYKRYL